MTVTVRRGTRSQSRRQGGKHGGRKGPIIKMLLPFPWMTIMVVIIIVMTRRTADVWSLSPSYIKALILKLRSN